ncbi:MAG: hypothetical protein PHC35_05560 [Deltaproteobacteria bacterium]|nr:hypothetical protein [Deltaproteobacteria bacterium]
MRQYVIDELRPSEIDRIRTYLAKHCEMSDLDDFYWLLLPEDTLSEVQKGHVASCGPFGVGVQIGRDRLVIEFLVRSRKKIRCNCIAFANHSQRDFILAFADELVKFNNIVV